MIAQGSLLGARYKVREELGYIIQEFEFDPVGNQGTGFVATQAVEYEDALALDRCFGNRVLEGLISIGNAL